MQIVLVEDNLSTHSKAALYRAFPAPEARRLATRFDFHFTPRHGSWLNMQEVEFSALARHALQKRVSDQAALEGTVGHSHPPHLDSELDQHPLYGVQLTRLLA